MSETAITGASRAKIYKLRMEGNKQAENVTNLLEHKDRLITTVLLGNNAVNTGAASLTTAYFIEVFGKDGNGGEVIFYATIVMTLAILIFAEVLPKVYAIKNSERTALAVGGLLGFLVKIFYPVTYTVEKIVGFFLRLFGLENKGMEGVVRGLDALRGALELYHNEGDVVKEDKDMLGSIIDLDNMEVSETMQHRKDMEAIDISSSNEEIMAQMLKSQYSRIPVYENRPDNIIGILHSKKLMTMLVDDSEHNIRNINIRSILMEPWFVPESTTLKEQLLAFKEKKQHFALVVDEYGSLMGMITLEDILEEIVGNIEDEYDSDIRAIERDETGAFIVDGKTPIRDLNRAMDWTLPVEEANTIAGLLIAEAQMIPAKGQVFHFYDFRFEVLKKKRNQITRIKIIKLNEDVSE